MEPLSNKRLLTGLFRKLCFELPHIRLLLGTTYPALCGGKVYPGISHAVMVERLLIEAHVIKYACRTSRVPV